MEKTCLWSQYIMSECLPLAFTFNSGFCYSVEIKTFALSYSAYLLPDFVIADPDWELNT